jgi:hypothetical protein
MKYLILILLVFATCNITYAGGCTNPNLGPPSSPPPSCTNNPPAGNTCGTATPICDLNGYCGSTAASYTADYWSQLNSAFCGSIENNSFLKFTASSTSLNFNVWLTSSECGDGIQIYVFSTASGGCSGAVTGYLCWNPGTASAGPANLTANGLTPGQEYFIMIDGQAGDVSEYIIGVNSGAALPLDLNPENATICAGESVNLTASGGNGTYSWTASPDLSATSGETVIATPPGPGTFTYTVNSANGNPLCPSDVSESVTITVEDCGGCIVTASNSGNVCQGGSVNLSATTIAGATYSWTGPNGFTSNLQNPTNIPLPAAPGSYVYSVTVNDNGYECISNTTVVIYPSPAVSAGGNHTVCSGESITLTATGAHDYVWTGGITNGVPFTPTATTIYTVTGTDANGCVNTSDAVITVQDEITPTFNPITSVCQGAAAPTLPAVSSNGIAGTWSGTVSTAAAGTFPFTFTPTNSTCTNTAQISVTINPLPIANAGADQDVCAQGHSNSLHGSGGVSQTWNKWCTE